MKKIYFLGIMLIFLFQSNYSVNFVEIFLENKTNLAIESSLLRNGVLDVSIAFSHLAIEPSQLRNSCLDVSIAFSEEDKKACMNLYSSWHILSDVELIKRVKFLSNRIFKISRRAEGLYTGTLVSHLFFAFYQNYSESYNTFIETDLFSKKLECKDQGSSSIQNILNILKILIDLDFDTYAFGVFFELIEFGSEKTGNIVLVEDYYYKLFEKITKSNNVSLFLNIATNINFIFNIDNPILNSLLSKRVDYNVVELKLLLYNQTRKENIINYSYFFINIFSKKLKI